MGFSEYEFDVTRLWSEPGETSEAEIRRPRRSCPGSTVVLFPFRGRAVGRAKEGQSNPWHGEAPERRCRSEMQSRALELAAADPDTAPAAIIEILDECAACKRCVGI